MLDQKKSNGILWVTTIKCVVGDNAGSKEMKKGDEETSFRGGSQRVPEPLEGTVWDGNVSFHCKKGWVK